MRAERHEVALNGVEVLQRLRGDPRLRHAHIIALTGRHACESRADETPTDEPRFDDYLLEPVEMSVLCKVLAAALTKAPELHRALALLDWARMM